MLRRKTRHAALPDCHATCEMLTIHLQVSPLTMLESNAIRYMVDYVALKLLKKFKRHLKNTAIQQRNKLFVKMLEGMKALQQPGEPDSVAEYRTLWIELID